MMGEDFICHSNTENYFFNENSTLAFYELFRKLQNKFDCSHMFFCYEKTDSSQRIVFQTDPEWQDYFIRENLIKDCHLFAMGRKLMSENKSKFLIVPWDLVKPATQKQVLVCGARKDRKIDHGISITREYHNIREILGLAAEPNNKNFYKYLLEDKIMLKETLQQSRFIALNAMRRKNWLPKKAVELILQYLST